MESSQPGIESCPSVFVKDKGLLEMTRNRKMVRSRRRRHLCSRPTMESSQAVQATLKEGYAEPSGHFSRNPSSYDAVINGKDGGRLLPDVPGSDSVL